MKYLTPTISFLFKPLVLIHLLFFSMLFYVEFSWVGVVILLISLVIRMFGITAGFHRYFSHRSFKTGRVFQFILALLGTSAAQRGPLWWAAHHRDHHKHSDTDLDIHSPHKSSFWYSHFGWLLDKKYNSLNKGKMQDFLKFKDIVFIDNFHYIVVFLYATLLFVIGDLLSNQYDINGFQSFIWGFLFSTVFLYHITFSINSLSHLFGSKNFKTGDNSRNNFIISLFAMGEGWHNNHHFYPQSERQGFMWWEIDMTHMILKFLSFFKIVTHIKSPPQRVMNQRTNGK